MNKKIKNYIIAATGPKGENLILVQFLDDTLGITRDGHPIEGWIWENNEIDTAVLTFMLLADLDFPINDGDLDELIEM